MSSSYKTVKEYGEAEFVEKRSRFIGYCKPVKTEEDAIAFINEKSQSTGTQPITYTPIV